MSDKRLRSLRGAELFLLAGICIGCSDSRDSLPGPEVLALYAGGQVTLAELDRYTERLLSDEQSATASTDRSRPAVLRELAVRKVLVANVPADEPRLEAVRREVRRRELESALLAEFGWNDLTVSEAEVRREYDQHPATYNDPDKLRLQTIYLRSERDLATPIERQATRERLEGLRRQVLERADFTALAQAHSDSETASAGGWLALEKGAKVPPAFAEEVWSLEPGAVSEVIESKTGFHLAKLISVIPAIERPYEEIHEFARRQALNEKLDQLQEEFVAAVGPQHGLVTHLDRLRDPKADADTILIEIGESSYTMGMLESQLPQTLVSHLYNGHWPTIEAFLDRVTLREVLTAEAELRSLDAEIDLERAEGIATDQARFEIALARELQAEMDGIPVGVLKDYFEDNKARYQTLTNSDLQVIHIRNEPGESDWQVLHRAEAVAERARQGEDFGSLAREYSQHYSADEDGLIEELTEYGISQYVQSRARSKRIINELEPGEVSDAFGAVVYDSESLSFKRAGAYVVKLLERRPPRQADFDEVEDMVRSNYLNRHFQELREAVFQRIEEEAEIRLLTEKLPQL